MEKDLFGFEATMKLWWFAYVNWSNSLDCCLSRPHFHQLLWK